ncbi:hypothetical protein RvY_16406-1 [Ramazzottius varieornatus]|uniref:dTMP kinase n=1 Tax=Ramazzottius varieornatus TaxID=947166 RepID=A0A1D1W144_RAMVA|nr:hypothetical protein RvY_16406-1 [Ramazzottius varieornatus]
MFRKISPPKFLGICPTSGLLLYREITVRVPQSRTGYDHMLPGSTVMKRASSLIVGLHEVFCSSPPLLSFHSSYRLMEQRYVRGALIVFEGLDRSGKTTQVNRLLQDLEGTKERYPYRGMRFPDRTPANPINIEICDYLSKKKELPAREAHLLFTKQRQNQKDEMERFLQNGTTLVVDRYSHSGAAYSAAKRVNASKTEEEIAAEVRQAVLRVIEECREKPISHFGDKQEETNQLQLAVPHLPHHQCTPTKSQQSSKEPGASLVGCEVK